MHLRNQPMPTAPPATTEANTPARTGQVLAFRAKPRTHREKVVILEIFNKNFTLIERRTLEAGSVPRVGEFIELDQPLSARVQNLTQAMVHEVIWEMDGSKLLPVVSCHATENNPSNRLIRLEENGWLQPRD